MFAVNFRCILEVLHLQGLPKKFWEHFHSLCPKTKMFAVKFRRILEVLGLQGFPKNFWAHFTVYVSKNKDVCREVRTHFGGSPLPRFTKKVLGAIFKKFASRNKAVCCEVHMHLGSFRLARFIKNVLGAFSRFMCPKMKMFAVKLRCILEVLRLQIYRKNSGHIFTIYVSKNKAVCCEVHMHLGSFHIAKFVKYVLGRFSWFMWMKMMLCAVQFRRSLEVFRWQDWWKVLSAFSWYMCHANKHSWLPHSCGSYVKCFGHVLHFYAPINLCCIVQVHCEVFDIL